MRRVVFYSACRRRSVRYYEFVNSLNSLHLLQNLVRKFMSVLGPRRPVYGGRDPDFCSHLLPFVSTLANTNQVLDETIPTNSRDLPDVSPGGSL